MAVMMYPKNLVGLKFGEWEVIAKGKGSKWLCRCSCGVEREVDRGNLVTFDSTSCGHDSNKDQLIELKGKHFGELEVIEYDKGKKKWLCQCSCGNTVYKRSWDLRNGKGKTCGDTSKHTSKRLVDLTNKQFGELIAIEYIRSGVKGIAGTWKCECSCGKIIYVEASLLVNGKKKSCGHTLNQFKVIDITGQQFGELTAVKRSISTGKWDCVCSCGKHKEVYISKLRSGLITSCGHEYNPLINLSGQRFGKLVVIEYNKPLNKWLCKCDCGNTKYVYSQHLRIGDTRSCGCTKTRLTVEEIEESINKLKSELGRKPYIFEVSDDLNILENYIRKKLQEKYKNTNLLGKCLNRSKFELEVLQFVKETYMDGDIIESDRSILSGTEIDILTPVVAIECNGNYYHSNKFKDNTYHQNKIIEASRKGVKLVHIYEHEWNIEENKIRIKNYLNSILNKKSLHKVYARDTVLEEINTEEAKEFINNNHLQGYSKAKIKLALKYKDSIVAVMTFDKDRFNNEYEYEMIRYCVLANNVVIGGAEKLFKHFIDKYEPKSVVSYCNMDKFTGQVYTRLGFEILGVTKPGYFWSNHRATHVLNRYQTMKQLLVENGLGNEDQTEDEIMEGLGYFKVYNSGNLKFLWLNEEEH